MSARRKKRVPEDKERDFWAENDVVDYFDWDNSIDGSFPALKPSTQGRPLPEPPQDLPG